ncbi:MAG: hypothetical protein A4C66_10280 [Nitrospira sp. HN-bin3]|nr:MAG: hypothetical protein A4C66_10280 [Nitrospira sp. HN-bin3]
MVPVSRDAFWGRSTADHSFLQRSTYHTQAPKWYFADSSLRFDNNGLCRDPLAENVKAGYQWRVGQIYEK